jgi:hypothetical protein
MNRTFLPLCGLSIVLLVTAFVLGFQIDDLTLPDPAVQAAFSWHFLTALAALCFATLVHAVVLTYFMGTGRWIEETSQAYHLPAALSHENQRIKNLLIPLIVGCFLLLLATGALGAAADPGSPVQFAGAWGLSATIWHRTLSVVTLVANLGVNYWEYLALFRNGEIVDTVLREVRRIRLEKGLAVE